MRNRSFAMSLLGMAVGMLCLAYASVPLYRVFCAVTGFGGTTQEGKPSPVAGKVLERQIRVTFNSDVDPKLPWAFHPMQREMTVKIGERKLAFFEAVNKGDHPVTGMATYNVTPHKAGMYFNKLQCFCFEKQTLQPGQRVEMPVAFFIDPAMANDPLTQEIETITLSYTFFPLKE
jgi:cytochrome c oxidase assembly protein subunit 11